jgi:hypothetical protein
MYPKKTEIWEPFCGGGAVTLALSKVGFHVHASDIHPDLILMWQSIVAGDDSVTADVSEEEYNALKAAPPSARRGFVGFGASFGGGWFGGFGRRKLCGGAPASAQPFEESQRSVRKLRGCDAVFTHMPYTDTPDDALVYADIPYRGTKTYNRSAFDHAAFWRWVRGRQGPTFVSELAGPDDMQVVWRKAHKSQMASNSPTSSPTSSIVHREERLYYWPGRQP